MEPIKEEVRKGQTIVVLTRDTRPGVLVEIDQVHNQNGYPVTAIIYGLYSLRDTDVANLAPMRVRNYNLLRSADSGGAFRKRSERSRANTHKMPENIRVEG